MKPFKDYNALGRWVNENHKCPICMSGKPAAFICGKCHTKWMAETPSDQIYDVDLFTNYVNMKLTNTWTVPCAECDRLAQEGDYLCLRCRNG